MRGPLAIPGMANLNHLCKHVGVESMPVAAAAGGRDDAERVASMWEQGQGKGTRGVASLCTVVAAARAGCKHVGGGSVPVAATARGRDDAERDASM